MPHRVLRTHNRLMQNNDKKPIVLRLDAGMVKRLDKAAAENGRTRTAEIISRLEPSEAERRLAALEREIQEMKAMLRRLLDVAE